VAKVTKEEIESVIDTCVSFRELVTRLGRSPNGGNIAIMQRRCERMNIDTSHMLGKAHRKGTPLRRKHTPEEILIERDPTQCRAHPHLLRRALIESGIPYKCSECPCDGTWNGKEITLHVDHIDGKYWDCRKHNLRFMCPNCHSQTSTYCGKNVNNAPVR
jgi:hypothetical protein